jgi:hypothetical protein
MEDDGKLRFILLLMILDKLTPISTDGPSSYPKFIVLIWRDGFGKCNTRNEIEVSKNTRNSLKI